MALAVSSLGREHADRDALEELPQPSNAPRYIATHDQLSSNSCAGFNVAFRLQLLEIRERT